MHLLTGIGDKVSHGLVIYFQFFFQISNRPEMCSGIYKNVTIYKSNDWKSWNGGQQKLWKIIWIRKSDITAISYLSRPI
jgi:hypothetical protein